MHIAAPEQCICVPAFPHKGMTYLFTDRLLAVSTTLSVLDDRAFREEVPCLR
jgi:hypothetical protein